MKRGGDACLECKVISDPHVKCRVWWEHNGSPIKPSDSPRYHLAESPPIYSLEISGVQEGDTGVYRCVASSVFHKEEAQGEVELTLQGTLVGTNYTTKRKSLCVLVSVQTQLLNQTDQTDCCLGAGGRFWFQSGTCISLLYSLTQMIGGGTAAE